MNDETSIMAVNLAEERASREPLSLAPVEKTLFSKNFIRQAVCELKFPTLFDLDASKPPALFAKALRKEYPNQETGKSVTLGLGEETSHTFHHNFRSRGHKWTVTLRPSAVVLETDSYGGFDEFRSRLGLIVEAAASVIDSDFYTRVGLRYINAVPYERATIANWVNPALVSVLGSGVLGEPLEYAGRAIGVTEIGGYILQHGILTSGQRNKSIGALGVGQDHKTSISKANQTEYSLDFDLYAEDVSASDVLSTLDQLHGLEYSLFSWALGPAAKEYLGPSIR